MSDTSTDLDLPAAALAQFQESADPALCTWPTESTLHTRANANDQWPRPITPLSQDLMGLPQERGLEDSFCGVLGITKPSPDWTWNGVFYGWYTFAVGPAAELADGLPGWTRAGVYSDYFGVEEDPDAPSASAGRPNPLHVLAVLKNFVGALRSYPKQSAALRVEAERQLAADLERDWTVADAQELVTRLREHVVVHRAQRVPHVLASVISAALFNQCVKTVGKAIPDQDPARLMADAMSALGGVHLAEASQAMRRVASGEMSRDAFLATYGFRGHNEFEIASRPWRDDPTTLDKLIDAAGKHGGDPDHATRDAARARIRKALGWRWRLVAKQFSLTEEHMRWRENGKVPLALSAHSIRLVVREAGRRLAASGRLADAGDVVFLTADELVDELEGRPVDGISDLVARRRSTHEISTAFALPEMLDARPGELRLITPDRWRGIGMLPPAALEIGPRLNGVGVSQGTVTGRARVVHDPDDVDIEPGDVLVAPGTDSAWTPLFLQASAVVVDIGGIMSHSAIAAREVGIPAVVNVKVGTVVIQEGQTVTVDGTAGTVVLGDAAD